MSDQIILDILARIDSPSSVSFWRPKAWGETATSQQFKTGRDWVAIAGNALEAKLGSQRAPSTLMIRMTAFEPSASTGGTVDKVVTLGPPNEEWRLDTTDPEPATPTYFSPNIDATSPPIELRARLTVVVNEDHDLDLDLKLATYAPGDPDPPPSDPIIIADVPHPLPEPDE